MYSLLYACCFCLSPSTATQAREVVRAKFAEAGWDVRTNTATRDEPPTVDELHAFLEGTIEALETFEPPVGEEGRRGGGGRGGGQSLFCRGTIELSPFQGGEGAGRESLFCRGSIELSSSRKARGGRERVGGSALSWNYRASYRPSTKTAMRSNRPPVFFVKFFNIFVVASFYSLRHLPTPCIYICTITISVQAYSTVLNTFVFVKLIHALISVRSSTASSTTPPYPPPQPLSRDL